MNIAVSLQSVPGVSDENVGDVADAINEKLDNVETETNGSSLIVKFGTFSSLGQLGGVIKDAVQESISQAFDG